MTKRIPLIFLLLLITGATAPPADSDGDGLPDDNDASPNRASAQIEDQAHQFAAVDSDNTSAKEDPAWWGPPCLLSVVVIAGG